MGFRVSGWWFRAYLELGLRVCPGISTRLCRGHRTMAIRCESPTPYKAAEPRNLFLSGFGLTSCQNAPSFSAPRAGRQESARSARGPLGAAVVMVAGRRTGVLVELSPSTAKGLSATHVDGPGRKLCERARRAPGIITSQHNRMSKVGATELASVHFITSKRIREFSNRESGREGGRALLIKQLVRHDCLDPYHDPTSTPKDGPQALHPKTLKDHTCCLVQRCLAQSRSRLRPACNNWILSAYRLG